MRILKTLTTKLSPLFLLSGCVISTPFNGPGYESGQVQTEQPQVVVALTQATLGEDERANDLFWEYVGKVESSLPEQAGFIGYSKRKSLFGEDAWTMTVWETEQDLKMFVYSGVHMEAMQTAAYGLANVKTTNFVVNTKDIPLEWDIALSKLN